VRIIPFTNKGYEELKQKLELTIAKRPDAVIQLTKGRNMGDLSENGLYKAAKQELNDIDREIRNLKYLVRYGKVFKPQDNNSVQIGHNVIVESPNGEKEFLIVGEYEADPKIRKISHRSPIGHNLMGRRVNDEILITTPGGKIKYLIKQISL